MRSGAHDAPVRSIDQPSAGNGAMTKHPPHAVTRLALATCGLLASCASAPPREASGGAGGDLPAAHAAEPHTVEQHPSFEQQAFWDGLQALCGGAYGGTGIHVPATDTAFIGQDFVMHVAECSDGEIRIPFHAGDDRSRTWVLRRDAAGIELKHVHRHRDGTEASNSNYGGRTAARGTPHRQEFPADAVSVAAVPARISQWWFLEHYPGRRFAYGLFRQDGGLHYRIEFDLASPVAPPPPPW
jgi:hypothetical protein